MGIAMAASAAVHAYLLYGVSLPEARGPVREHMLIHARLDRVTPAPIIQGAQANARPRHRPAEPAEPPTIPQAESNPEAVASIPDAVAIAPTPVSAQVPPPLPAEPPVPIVDPVHYSAADLDVYPRTLQPIIPAYPSELHDQGASGEVTLEVMIDEVGTVVGTSIVDAAPQGIFEQAARDAVVSARFMPAQRHDRFVRSRVLLKVEFAPGREAAR